MRRQSTAMTDSGCRAWVICSSPPARTVGGSTDDLARSDWLGGGSPQSDLAGSTHLDRTVWELTEPALPQSGRMGKGINRWPKVLPYCR